MSSEAEAVFGDRYESIKRYVGILATRGIEHGFMGPREAERLWDRHILNSVAPAVLVPRNATVVDVGSGAGLPGIPLAILRPDLRITLIEPLLRRCNFISQAVAELEISGRVSVVRARADEHRGRYDVVTSRALAPLQKLVEWCGPLRSPAGIILAIKGISARDELALSRAFLAQKRLTGEIHEVRAHPDSETTYAIRITSMR